jgi:predicted RNA-binding protein with PIN domain
VRYWIDGHNLIGQLAGISLEDPNDEARLVGWLRQVMARQNQRCVVFFDAGLPGGLARDLSSGPVKVVFAHRGTSADALLMARIRQAPDPGAVMVVSDDREVIAAALQRRMRVISARDFARLVAAPAPSVAPDEKDPSPRLSPREVNEWLAEFGAEETDTAEG